jgi:hypothetical protein
MTNPVHITSINILEGRVLLSASHEEMIRHEHSGSLKGEEFVGWHREFHFENDSAFTE